MCGIAGFLKLNNAMNSNLNENHLKKMTKVLSHRGPDHDDIWSEENIFLGHTRLSILDLTSNGNQPMISKSKRFVITFNGEIYNYKELKNKLKSNIIWNGNSDTEVFLECIDVWGIEKTLKLSRGMFAFALWDRFKKTLILARDRVGEKPLYYGYLNGDLVFASELKSIKALKHSGLEINKKSMNLMIKFGYVPAPFSIYENIYKLPGGTKLEVTSNCKLNNPSQWWNINSIVEQSKTVQNQSLLENHLHDTLRLAVKEQMLSDVPIGAFLSGGIDSSLIVSLMQEQSIKKINTFTIGFTEADYDEAKYAKEISKILGTEHHEFYVSPKEALDIIPEIPFTYDEPFGDSSQIPTMLVSQLTSKHVKVCLSGDGGDELFGGYNRYLWSNSILNIFEKLPIKLRRVIASSLSVISPEKLSKIFNVMVCAFPSNIRYKNFGDKLHKFAQLLEFSSKEDLYLKMISQWREELPLIHNTDEYKFIKQIKNWDKDISYIENMMKIDMSLYLPDDILVKIDRAAMSNSLETRVPFLDERVIRASWNFSLDTKIVNRKGKIPLRNILKTYIPEHLIERPKQGFGVPIDTWLRGPLKNWASDLLDESKLKNNMFSNSDIITKKWKEHLNGERNWQHQIWNILMLQSWIENN